jgi:hypothetical protein
MGSADASKTPEAGSGWAGPAAPGSRGRTDRSSISVTTEAARSSSSARSRGDQIRGSESMTQSAPAVCPSAVTSGTPAYEIQPSSRMAGLVRTSGWRRASSTTRGAPDETT